MIRRALIVDTETTGLDPATGSVLEIGAILYAVDHRTPLVQFSSLLYAAENPAESINRIPAAAVRDMRYAVDPASVFLSLIDEADVIVAHNAEFDRAWLAGEWHTKPWICTKSDVTWPMQNRPGESLVSLVLAHGIGVASAHRALTDCQLIAALFSRVDACGGNLDELLARAMRPKKTYQAIVSFDDRELAKTAGFQWNAATKQWLRTLACDDAVSLPFPVREVA